MNLPLKSLALVSLALAAAQVASAAPASAEKISATLQTIDRVAAAGPFQPKLGLARELQGARLVSGR